MCPTIAIGWSAGSSIDQPGSQSSVCCSRVVFFNPFQPEAFDHFVLRVKYCRLFVR